MLFDVSLDGSKNHIKCLEYELIPKQQFPTGMLLSLLPPLEIRKGMLLLNKKNIEVVFDPTPVKE